LCFEIILFFLKDLPSASVFLKWGFDFCPFYRAFPTAWTAQRAVSTFLICQWHNPGKTVRFYMESDSLFSIGNSKMRCATIKAAKDNGETEIQNYLDFRRFAFLKPGG
jgi:hypothetical protein